MVDLKALRTEIEALEHPVFAVLDGAQFDNLPDALFDSDFVHKPLYLDRGGQGQDFELTAPQLVWLDRDANKAPQHEDAPAPDILNTLFDLIDDKPAAVFWECPTGSQALYRHLRGINMVMIPRSALPKEEQPHVEEEHVPMLFRHADANVMAQVFRNISYQLARRLFGPAKLIAFAPEEYWWDGGTAVLAVEAREEMTSNATVSLTSSDIANIEQNRRFGLKRRAVAELGPRLALSEQEARKRIDEAYDRAEGYDLESPEDIWRFIELDIEYGYEFERNEKFSKAAKELSYTELSPSVRVDNAVDACRSAFAGGL